MTFFRYARTKGGGTGSFVLFCPVLNCRNTLKVRYLLYYTRNIAQSALCRVWSAAKVRCRQAQSTSTNKTTHSKHGQDTRAFVLVLCSPCLSVSLSVCLSPCLSVCFPVPFCLNTRVNNWLNSYIER